MNVRSTALVLAIGGALLCAAGVAGAKGADGDCEGMDQEYYDPFTDSWVHDTQQFYCDGDCNSGTVTCQKEHSGEVTEGGFTFYSKQFCGCSDGGGSFTFDMVTIDVGGGQSVQAKKCDIRANLTVYGGFPQVTGNDCYGSCTNNSPPCDSSRRVYPHGTPSGYGYRWINGQYVYTQLRQVTCRC